MMGLTVDATVVEGGFALKAIDVSWFAKAYLEGSSLPHVTVTDRSLGAAVWLAGLYKGVPESDSFSGLPATLGRRVRYSYIVYPGCGCQIRDIEHNYP